MKRLVIITVIKMCGEVLFFTILAGIVVGVIGYLKKWDTSMAYSNALFIAGCLVIIAGGLSRLAAGQERDSFQLTYAESFREMSASERANYIVNASSSFRLVILGFSSGILLVLISWFVAKLF